MKTKMDILLECEIHWSVSRVDKGTERGAGRESGDRHQAAQRWGCYVEGCGLGAHICGKGEEEQQRKVTYFASMVL